MWAGSVREQCMKLEEERVKLALQLAEQPASSYEDYQRRVGVCEGLARAQAVLKNAAKEDLQ